MADGRPNLVEGRLLKNKYSTYVSHGNLFILGKNQVMEPVTLGRAWSWN
jgi:hypothetical protein